MLVCGKPTREQVATFYETQEHGKNSWLLGYNWNAVEMVLNPTKVGKENKHWEGVQWKYDLHSIVTINLKKINKSWGHDKSIIHEVDW